MEQILHLNDKEVKLFGEDFTDIDLQNVLQIDYSNLNEEVATFPYVLNQLNFMLIEADDILRKENFKLDILKDNLTDLKSRLSFGVIDVIKARGIKSPTLANIEDEISQDPDVKALKEQIRNQKEIVIQATTNRDKLTALYWSARSKMECLQNLSSKVNLE